MLTFFAVLRRPTQVLRCTYSSARVQRHFSLTHRLRSEDAKPAVPQHTSPETDLPQEILDEIPQEVHHEMKELGEAYSVQIQKLMASPEAVTALKDIKRLVEEMGINLREGEHLGTMQAMKLAANSQVREAGRRVMVEMDRAGVDMTKMEEIMWAMQKLEPDEDNSQEPSPKH